MSTPEQRRGYRKKCKPGFPKNENYFSSHEEVVEYFNGDQIVCLECGKDYRTLGVHLLKTHKMTPDEYRGKYSLPLYHGLSCEETTGLHGDTARHNFAIGAWEKPTLAQAECARMCKSGRNAAVVQRAALHNIMVYNKKLGRDGTATRKRLEGQSVFGSVEHKRRLAERPQCKNLGVRMASFWRGKPEPQSRKEARFRVLRKPRSLTIICVECGAEFGQTVNWPVAAKICSDECRKNRKNRKAREKYQTRCSGGHGPVHPTAGQAGKMAGRKGQACLTTIG